MKKIGIILCCLMIFMLGACVVRTVSAEQTNPIKIWFQNENGAYKTLYVVDEKTGVNYIVVGTELGNSYDSIAICPRYNADGTLYTGD